MKYNLITILGPTAAGKTRLAALLADKFNGEIISADSRQVYRRMNLGTGKDYADYLVNGTTIPYHLIDIAEPSEEFNLFRFKETFHTAFEDILSRCKIPFLTGGTGMYINSVVSNYKLGRAETDEATLEKLNSMSEEELRNILLSIAPEQHNKTDLEIKERIIRAIIVAQNRDNAPAFREISSLNIGVNFPRDVIKERITRRLKERLNEGMIEEVDALIKEGITFQKLSFFGLEYKFVGLYIKGEINKNDMFQKLNSAIHAFAKRQMTWYRKMEKEGVRIHWIDGVDFEKAGQIIEENYF